MHNHVNKLCGQMIMGQNVYSILNENDYIKWNIKAQMQCIELIEHLTKVADHGKKYKMNNILQVLCNKIIM